MGPHAAMMAVRHRDIALILARELALNVATPMFVWDERGELVFQNEHVQAILGNPYQEVGVGHLDELPNLAPHDLDGEPIEASDLPSAVAVRERRPAHRVLRILAKDGVQRTLTVTAFPLFGRGGDFVGAITVFWQVGEGS